MVQILHEAEILQPDDYVLTYSKRDSVNRLYTDLVQVKLRACRISDL